MRASDLPALPGLPLGAEGPVFAEPWQAQAFALAVRLNAEGLLPWGDWAAALSRELAGDPGDPGDDGSGYYRHWVAALEQVITARGLLSAPDLAARKAAWAEAYLHTPHGQPVELPSG